MPPRCRLRCAVIAGEELHRRAKSRRCATRGESTWHLFKLRTRSAEPYRWRCTDLPSATFAREPVIRRRELIFALACARRRPTSGSHRPDIGPILQGRSARPRPRQRPAVFTAWRFFGGGGLSPPPTPRSRNGTRDFTPNRFRGFLFTPVSTSQLTKT